MSLTNLSQTGHSPSKNLIQSRSLGICTIMEAMNAFAQTNQTNKPSPLAEQARVTLRLAVTCTTSTHHLKASSFTVDGTRINTTNGFSLFFLPSHSSTVTSSRVVNASTPASTKIVYGARHKLFHFCIQAGHHHIFASTEGSLEPGNRRSQNKQQSTRGKILASTLAHQSVLSSFHLPSSQGWWYSMSSVLVEADFPVATVHRSILPTQISA